MNYGKPIEDCFKKTKLLLGFVSCFTLLTEAQRQILWQVNKDQMVKTANEVITTINTIYMDKLGFKDWAGADFNRHVSKIYEMHALAGRVKKAGTNFSRISEVAVSYSRRLL